MPPHMSVGDSIEDENDDTQLAVISGTAVAPVMEQLAREIDPDGRRIHVLPVVNEHFGETVNVSGLLTGHDITEALRTLDAPVEGVLIPASALRLLPHLSAA